jgi:hypothetical protein
MSMSNRARVAAITALAGLAMTAYGQDSVSKVGGLPGDAVSPWAVNEQVNTYVVDLAPLTTSWGTEFGIAPLIKSSHTQVEYTNSLMSPQAISNTSLFDVPFHATSYMVWNGPGYGVNDDPTLNDPGTIINTAGMMGVQFATGFSEFGGNANNVIGGIVNYDPAEPTRLYVTRVTAAVNGFSDAENRAQIGYGGADASGFLHFRADDFGATGPNAIVGNNYFRVNLAARNPASLNVIDNSGGSDAPATDWVLVNSTTTHSTPTNLPMDINGTRPVLLGANFNNQYCYEMTPLNMACTSAHLNGSPNQRGTVSFSQHPHYTGSVGTCGMLGYNDNSLADALLIWGVNADGSYVTGERMPMPATVTDNSDGYVSTGLEEFCNFRSQVPFRGGNGQVAVGVDQAGRTLVAALADHDLLSPPDAFDPVNSMLVARDNSMGGWDWTLVAYNNFPNGKQILDGPGGAAIGQIVELDQVTGGSPLGPSMSSPMIDSVGNVWFISSVELYLRIDTDGDTIPDASDFDNALIRGVYDPATFSYELELVLELGSKFRGINSDRDWMVTFLNIADSNSISSATCWSGNILQDSWAGVDVSQADTTDPATLGGLVLTADVIYDVNDDGTFDELAGDEAYQVLLYVGNTTADDCPPDWNGDTVLNSSDFIAFLNDFVAGC